MRFWEIDAARGIAVLMMIAFHFLFDLNYFAGFSILLASGFWLVFARITLIIFLLLVGISLSISYSRAKGVLDAKGIMKKYVKRGLKIFAYGLIITAITFLAFPGSIIWFGVLHCIGISIILAIPLLWFKKLNLIIGLAAMLLGLLLFTQTFGFPWLLWLGLMPPNFYTFDYVPLLPWFGVVLLGLFLGKMLCEKRTPGKTPAASKPFCLLGRHSLLIYLLHQPVLVGLLLLVF